MWVLPKRANNVLPQNWVNNTVGVFFTTKRSKSRSSRPFTSLGHTPLLPGCEQSTSEFSFCFRANSFFFLTFPKSPGRGCKSRLLAGADDARRAKNTLLVAAAACNQPEDASATLACVSGGRRAEVTHMKTRGSGLNRANGGAAEIEVAS